MRVGRVTVFGVVAASALGAGVASSSLLSRPAAAQVTPVKSVGVQLPVQDFRDIELDEDRGRLYLAQGVGAGSPTVTANYRAPQGACVFHVEPTGGKVVGAYSNCGIGSGGLLVWSTPDATPVVYTQGPNLR